MNQQEVNNTIGMKINDAVSYIGKYGYTVSIASDDGNRQPIAINVPMRVLLYIKDGIVSSARIG